MKIKFNSKHLVVLIKVHLTWDDGKVKTKFDTKEDEILFKNLQVLYELRKADFKKKWMNKNSKRYTTVKKQFDWYYGMYLEIIDNNTYYHFNLS